jgi:hypothetical protein
MIPGMTEKSQLVSLDASPGWIALHAPAVILSETVW